MKFRNKILKWFSDAIDNIEDLKSAYRKLAMKYHPDRGGTNEQMKEINDEYSFLFEKVKDIHKSTYTDGPRTYTAKEKTKETPFDFINIVNELFKLDGLEIELCGRWLWIDGNTIQHKDALKKLGCKWSAKKQKWSWHFPEDSAVKYKNRKEWDMEKIRSYFGSEHLGTEEERKQSVNRKQLAPAV